MKTTTPRAPRPSRETKRPFTWGVRTTEIGFMRSTASEAAMEGSASGCQDCSAIAPFDQPRPKRPVRSGESGGSDGGSNGSGGSA